MQAAQGRPPGAVALSLPSRIAVSVAVGAVTVGALCHLAMVFLHVAPQNTLSRQHSAGIYDYIYPEFEQNWKLFAPDPLQQNVHVQARAQVRKADGSVETTGWVDMTGMDIAAMRHDPLPSHTRQNELRRAWSFYADTHDAGDQPTARDRGDLSRTYLLRVLERRFGPRLNGGDVIRIQARAATTPVPPPAGGGTTTGTATQYRVLPWWDADSRQAARENDS